MFPLAWGVLCCRCARAARLHPVHARLLLLAPVAGPWGRGGSSEKSRDGWISGAAERTASLPRTGLDPAAAGVTAWALDQFAIIQRRPTRLTSAWSSQCCDENWLLPVRWHSDG